MSLRDYHRSNRLRSVAVSLDGDARVSLRRLLGVASAQDRQRWGADLVSALCRRAGASAPRLIVLETPRPHRLREGRLTYQKLGSYSTRTRTIRVHNRTARLKRTVAARTFLETLLHELMHHWDFELLGLKRSLHTSGFYHRLGDVKRRLLAMARAPLDP